MNSEMIKLESEKRKLNLLVLKPEKTVKNPPGVLWIHGGGYLTGFKEMVYFSRAKSLVEKFGAVVISPGYRLSFQKPFPAALEDCYSALKFLKNNSEWLGINSEQIMVGGESAGGGLAVALTLLARDQNSVNIAYQTPLYPMISFEDTITSKNNYQFPWNTLTNHYAWDRYLKGLKSVNKYASPSVETNFSQLPPAYSFVGINEPFYQETLDYFLNLRKAGISADLDVYPTGFHAFDMLLPGNKLSKKAIQNFEDHFDYAKKHYFNPKIN